MTCSHCGHPVGHPPSSFGRADGPVGCDGCPTCEDRRVRLGLPTAFRVAHLVVLQCADDLAVELATDVVPFQVLVDRLESELQESGLLAGEVRRQWGDASWLAQDLEDWEQVVLRRERVRSLTSPSRGDQPHVAGLSLSAEGRTTLELMGTWRRARISDLSRG